MASHLWWLAPPFSLTMLASDLSGPAIGVWCCKDMPNAIRRFEIVAQDNTTWRPACVPGYTAIFDQPLSPKF
jgi:hypothetical protein